MFSILAPAKRPAVEALYRRWHINASSSHLDFVPWVQIRQQRSLNLGYRFLIRAGNRAVVVQSHRQHSITDPDRDSAKRAGYFTKEGAMHCECDVASHDQGREGTM